MKKIYFAVLAIMLLMSACAAAPDTTLTRENTTGDLSVDVTMTGANDLGEYNELMATMEEIYGVKLPENFITWEKLELFGPFSSFVLVDKEEMYYIYNIKNPRGRSVSLCIYHMPNGYLDQEVTEISLTEDMKAEMTDMLRIPGNDNVVIKRNGYQYRYYEGYLASIDWMIDGIQFDLCEFRYAFSKSGIPEGTFISRLLSVSEAESDAAFAELRQSLTAE